MLDIEKRKSQIESDLRNLDSVLNEARLDFENDSESFYAKKIFKMGRFIRMYAELMGHLDVLVGDEVEDALAEFGFDQRQKEFLKGWDLFLSEIEQKANFNINDELSQIESLYLNENDFVKIESDNNQSLSLLRLHKNFLGMHSTELNKSKASSMLLVMLRHFAW
jgi:hypothetical protein